MYVCTYMYACCAATASQLKRQLWFSVNQLVGNNHYNDVCTSMSQLHNAYLHKDSRILNVAMAESFGYELLSFKTVIIMVYLLLAWGLVFHFSIMDGKSSLIQPCIVVQESLYTYLKITCVNLKWLWQQNHFDYNV